MPMPFSKSQTLSKLEEPMTLDTTYVSKKSPMPTANIDVLVGGIVFKISDKF